jgi:hypothetical protein
MRPHSLTLSLCLFLLLVQVDALGQRKAVVADERLSALRATPQLTGKLVRRLGRGRLVAIRSVKTNADGVTYFFVNVTTRTRGWIQREAVVSPSRIGDDQRLLRLIQTAHGFDRISRAKIFLDNFRRSPLRPQVLLILGDTAAELSAQLPKINNDTFAAPEFTYYLNHSSLDRFNRQGVNFIFDKSTKRLHYDGAAYRLLLRHHPNSPEARIARERLVRIKQSS